MVLASILLTVALLGQAQSETPPTPDQVRALLSSGDALDQAWGAWWTSESRLRNVEPLLQKNLEAHVHGSTWQDVAVVDTTLDAYIQTNSSPPPVELLESVYEHRPAQSLILLSRVAPSARADAFLLKLMHSESNRREGLEWFAAANVLLEHRTPGFVGSVLRDLRIKAYVTVCDSGAQCLARGADRRRGDGGRGGEEAPGSPPWPFYTLGFANDAQPASTADPILATGPVRVTYSRRVSPSGRVAGPLYSSGRMPGSLTPPRPYTPERLRYVAAALEMGLPGTRLSIQDDDLRAIPWHTEPAFTANIERIREDIRNRYAALIQQLSSNSLLSTEEAAELAIPRIEVVVYDLRSVKTPLGDLGNP